MFAKCANPKCSTGFDYHLGGKFYRFHQNEQAPRVERNTHAVVHFWLCPRCAQTHTLDYDGVHCLVIRSVGLEDFEVSIPATVMPGGQRWNPDAGKKLPAAESGRSGGKGAAS